MGDHPHRKKKPSKTGDLMGFYDGLMGFNGGLMDLIGYTLW